MFQLVYASTATKLFSSRGLLEVMPRYREKNLRLGITGLLLYKQGSFMQALEGEEAAVRTLYAAIRADSQHHHVLTLMALTVPERRFPNWSMGFKDLSAMGVADVPGYAPCPALPLASDEISWQASVALSLLATFQEDD